MSAIYRFEDLEIWQIARKQSSDIFQLVQQLSFDRTLADQILRSSGSVMDNIAEGFNRHSTKEFIQFLIIARGSNAEVRSQLYRIQDHRKASEDDIMPYMKNSETLGKKITALLRYLRNCNYKSKSIQRKK